MEKNEAFEVIAKVVSPLTFSLAQLNEANEVMEALTVLSVAIGYKPKEVEQKPEEVKEESKKK